MKTSGVRKDGRKTTAKQSGPSVKSRTSHHSDLPAVPASLATTKTLFQQLFWKQSSQEEATVENVSSQFRPSTSLCQSQHSGMKMQTRSSQSFSRNRRGPKNSTLTSSTSVTRVEIRSESDVMKQKWLLKTPTDSRQAVGACKHSNAF